MKLIAFSLAIILIAAAVVPSQTGQPQSSVLSRQAGDRNVPQSAGGQTNKLPSGQTKPDQDDTLIFDSALVNTFVTVRDEKGRFVSGLTKGDFTVLDDGQEQTVSYLSREANLPFTVALVVDRSRSVQHALTQAQAAAREFFRAVLRPGKDQAAVVAFDSGVYLLQDLTDDANALGRAVDQLSSAGGTSIFDAVYKTVRDRLAGSTEGRRVIVLITDGDDTTSRASIDQAIELALRHNVIIYAVRLPGDGSLNVHALRGRPVLEHLTEATGGREFDLTKGESRLTAFFGQLQDELRSQYSIGYQFQGAASAGGFHKLTIKSRQSNLNVFTRSGYYAGAQ